MRQIALYILTALLLASTSGFAQKKVSYTYPNGNKKEEGILVEGEKDGKWTEWNENGTLKSEILYKNGNIQEEKLYSNNGNIMREKFYNRHPLFVYENDYTDGWLYLESLTFKKNGKHVAYKYIYNEETTFYYYIEECMQKFGIPYISLYKDGTVSEVRCGTNMESWDKDGTLREIDGYFYDGNKYWYRWNKSGERVDNLYNIIENDTVTFDKNGIKPRLQYSLKNNRFHGVCKDYYTNGQLWFEVEFDNGVPVGDYQSFYFNGTPQLKTHFTNGFVDGKYTEWYENGNKRIEGYMNHCMKDSLWQHWSENGTLIKKESYKNNVLDGEYCVYFIDGSHKEKKNYKNGKLDGWEYVYWAKDTLLSVKYYIRGHTDCSEQKEFHRNGNLMKLSYPYDVNLKIQYYKEGDLMSLSGDLFSMSWDKDGTLKSIAYSVDNNNSAYLHFTNGQISSSNCRIKHKTTNSIPYAWMYPKDGKLEFKQVGDSIDGKREGKWQLYYPTGDLWIEMNYKNDLLDGEYTVRTVNGQIVKKCNLTNGLLNGTYEKWSITGNKLVERNYKNGKQDGLQKYWVDRDKYDIRSLKRHCFNCNKNDFKHKYYLWKIAHYSNGIENGEFYSFSANGDTLKHTNYRNGKKDGINNVYDETKHYLLESYTYKEGKKQGAAFFYSPKGNVLWKGNYLNDKKHGEWIQYDDANKEISRVQYEYGDIILEPINIDLECQCATNYNTQSDIKYASLLSKFTDYKTFSNATNKYLIIDENIYKKLYFFSQVYSSHLISTICENLDIIAFDTLWFETPATKGLRFVVNPCLNENQYSSTSIGISYRNNLIHLVDDKFDYKATSFFKLSMEEINYISELEFTLIFVNFIKNLKSISEEKAYKKFKQLLRLNGVMMPLPDQLYQLDFLTEEQKDKFWDKEERIINIIANAYFKFGRINLEKINPRFETRFNTFYKDNFTFEDFVKYLFLYYEAYTNINQIAIDIPQNILAQWDTKNKCLAQYKGNTIGARLLLSVNPIEFYCYNGFNLENQNNFCFTPAAIGGKNCILNTNEAKVFPTTNDFPSILGTNQYEEHNTTTPKTPFEKFILKNSYTTFAGVYIPYGNGSIMLNEKEIDIRYKDVFISGKYILGQIHIHNNYIENPKLTKLLKEYFPVYQIETNTEEETVIYFLYK